MSQAVENSKKRITLKDVAREAGVSVGTVSHYLNNPESVKPANRRRIEDRINDLGFIPNASARSLASGKSRNVMLFVLSERVISPTTWLHQLPIIQTIHDVLSKKGYSFQICIVYEEDYAAFSDKVHNCVESRAADGIIILSVWEVRRELINYLLERDYPFVCLDNEGEYKDASYVCFDNYGMMRDMVDLAYRNGHKKIAYITVRSHQQDMRRRFEGFVDGMKARGLKVSAEMILYGDFSIASGKACVGDALDLGSEFTAILCGNDNMAVGAAQAVQERNMTVPGDISVVGVDNSIAAHACSPRLQTVEFDLHRLAQKGVKVLMDKMERRRAATGVIRLGYKAISGDSLGYAAESGAPARE